MHTSVEIRCDRSDSDPRKVSLYRAFHGEIAFGRPTKAQHRRSESIIRWRRWFSPEVAEIPSARICKQV
jgi:hypothetical protein